MFNAEPIDIKKDLAEIKQAIKKEFALFRQMQQQHPMVAISFIALSIIMLVATVCFLLLLFDKTGHIDRFLAWWHGATLLEKISNVVAFVSFLFLGFYVVIKPPKGFMRWLIYPPFVPRFSEKTEQAIIQAPVKVFDCVYYSIKNRFFSNKK